MEKVEAKLRTSLRSTKASVSHKKDKDLDIAGDFHYKNSDDEVDEFFDRTQQHKFNTVKATLQGAENTFDTYETIKA